MPARQKSCNTCFRGKRRCDLNYPICDRCRNNNRACHYRYASPSQLTTKRAFGDAATIVDQSRDGATSADLNWWSDKAFEIDLNNNNNNHSHGRLLDELLHPSVPDMLGPLGELQPVAGNTKSWTWVIEQLKSYPRAFAQHAETVFIHKDLVRESLPKSLLSAFGICTAYACKNEANQFILYQNLDAAVKELLKPALSSTSSFEDLSRMQALLLCQIIRLFCSDLEQRTLAEHHQSVLGAWGLKLLRRATVELQETQSSVQTWQTWLLAESIRRTVLVAFMVSAVYSVFKYGVCIELPTLNMLPVSIKQACWHSRETYLQYSQEDEVMKYGEFTALWLASTPKRLDPFEKMILVACKGIETVEALSSHNDTE